MLKRRILLLFSMIGVIVLLAGCTEINQPITAESEGFWNTYIVYPLSQLITYVANLTNENFGLAIIIVTILIRLLILPLMIKQTKSSKAMQASSLKCKNFAKNTVLKIKNAAEASTGNDGSCRSTGLTRLPDVSRS